MVPNTFSATGFTGIGVCLHGTEKIEDFELPETASEMGPFYLSILFSAENILRAKDMPT